MVFPMGPDTISGKGEIPYQIFLWNFGHQEIRCRIIKAELKYDELLHLHSKCKENMVKKFWSK